MKECKQRTKIDLKLDNLNDVIKWSRYNKYKANQEKQKEMLLISQYIQHLKPVKRYPVRINCTWHVKNTQSDLDNKILKSVLDAMQKAGIIENDNIKHINEINNKAIKDDSDFLELEIIEWSDSVGNHTKGHEKRNS